MLPTLHSDRLVLRPWAPEDTEAVLDLYSRWDVVQYLGTNPKTLTQPAEAATRIAVWAGFPGPLHGVWAIVPAGGGQPIGTALLKLLPDSGSGTPSKHTEVGWHLHPEAWGHGYATEAGRRLLEHAWEQGLAEVFAVTYPQNSASQAVCRRLGMAPLGLTDRFYDVTCELFRADRPR